jgi:hypothetical protein
MKLWLIETIQDCGYDVANAFVVRAETEKEARKFASKGRGDEGEKHWLDESKSTCVQLSAGKGPLGIILRDFTSG